MPRDDFVAEIVDPNVKNLDTLAFLNENINAISFLEKREVISPRESTRVSKRATLIDSLNSPEHFPRE